MPSTILIVDDVAANRDTLMELLQHRDFRLAEAADGSTALNLAAESPPDLMLLDVMMPGMDGFQVCRRLRADPRLAEVPVIMVTALDDQASRLAGIEAGADDFVSKPFNRVELRARVRTITRLNRYRRLNEQRQQFQWIVEHAPDGYVAVNAFDEILFANTRARLWLGLPPEGGDGAREKFLASASRNYLGQPAELWQSWPEIPSAALASPRLLVRPETRDARAFFLEVTVHENSSGRLLRLCDVTERLAARRDQRSFQARVSHKLRTPLNGLHGCLELLAEPEALITGEIAEFVEMARTSAARLVGAVEDVLRFAELSQRPLHGAPFMLTAFGELVSGVAASLSLSNVTVSVAAEALPMGIPCGSETLEWVLSELLENARKFHPRRAPAVEVAAHLDGNETMVVTVTDDGLTLSPEQLAQAGTPYFQDEKHFTGEVPGMGLGLASVATALWQAGGTCRVRNRPTAPGVCVELQWRRVMGDE